MSEINQKDLVLSINEYAYVLDETKGNISCLVGPYKSSLSQSDRLVRFNAITKKFEPSSYDAAKSLFVTAPESWYVILKNPAESNTHPTPGTSNSLPNTMLTGEKINIRGPVSFALYPGQMATVVHGHVLRSNQYLLARVYEATSANSNQGEVLDAEGNPVETKNNYVNGQILIIKGTEVSFYIPPTGIEVIPVEGSHGQSYIRNAVTLERLEYAILKNESGTKRYVHGPKVVFPEPEESFVETPSGSPIFRAIELSKISGIYIKVIADYEDCAEGNSDDSTTRSTMHHAGEELFITGADQMIYYPRTEHAIIRYGDKVLHHAIAIPEGEGRYVMDRLSGRITTVKGPAMFLPDPRTQVIVQRKLSKKECDLFYPGNQDVLAHNIGLSAPTGNLVCSSVCLDDISVDSNCVTTKTINASDIDTTSGFSRNTSYSKPRTITLDNKYDGVVCIDVWTGYAINVVSKDGTRNVVCGPKSILLDYDQTLAEMQLSTGKPKTTDRLCHTAFLQYESNKISDIINVETSDFVSASIKVSYCVTFDKEYMDNWFAIENYVKYLCDRERSLIKRAAKQYTIDAFYNDYADIVRNIAIDAESESYEGKHEGRFFVENGMYVYDCEVLSIDIDSEVADMLEQHQRSMIEKSLELSAASQRILIAEKLAEAEEKEQKLRSQTLLNEMELQETQDKRKLEIHSAHNRRVEAEKLAATKAEQDVQPILDAISEAKLARKKKERDAEIVYQTELVKIEAKQRDAYANAVVKAMEAIQPDLVAALESNANADVMKVVSENLAPYALAEGEGVADFVDKLMRGTTVEGVLKNIASKDKNA